MVDTPKTELTGTDRDAALAAADAAVEPATLEAMVKAGVLYGRAKRKTNPKMGKYIFMTRSGIEIIDVTQTLALIDAAADFLAGALAGRGNVLVAGTTPAARDLARAFAVRLNCSSVTNRWLGGTLTNFKVISARIQHFLKLRADRDGGKLSQYTKKERLEFDRDIERMATLFTGLENMTTLPQALLVIGASAHETALREARQLNIPIVALLSTDADPTAVRYPIPAGDTARSSIAWVLDRLASRIETRRTELAAAVQAAAPKAE